MLLTKKKKKKIRLQNNRETEVEAKLQQLYHNFEQNREEINHLSSEVTRIRDDGIKGILLRAKVR